MKLRTGLFILVAGTVVPVLLLALVLGLMLIDHERETFRRGALDRNRAFLSAVDAALGGHATTLQALATSSNLATDNVTAFQRRLARILDSQPEWEDVLLSNPDGTRVASAKYPELVPGTPAADADSVRRAVATRKVVVGNITQRQPSGTWGVAVRYPVLRGNDVVYVVSAILRPAQFQKLIEAQQLPPGWVSGLVDGQHRFVARVPPRPMGDLASEAFRAQLTQAPEGWYRGRTVEGNDTFTAFARSERSGWAIGLAIPADVVTASSRRATWALGGGTVVAIALALLFAYFAGARIAAPIAGLARAARELGRGESTPAARPAPFAELADVDRALAESATLIRERQTLREREQAALRAADRAKDEFIAMLGHELRNPLSAISTSVHLLREAPRDSDAGRLARDIIERQARQMTRLVEDLMDIGRLTTGKLVLYREPVDLAALARNLVQTWQDTGRIAPGRVHVDARPAWVDADRTRLEQVLGNLVDNAIKFSGERSPIDVRVRVEGEDAVLEVEDRGEGIDAAIIDEVFRPFVQGPQDKHRPAGGLGLGLSVVQRLVQLHGGRIEAHSDGVGMGTLFIVRLPRIEPPGDRSEPQAAAQARRALRVLLVEDNADGREVMAAMLRLHGHDVQEAGSGLEALDLARAWRPEVALLDLGLPDIDGLEVARRIRRDAALEGMRLVALTGYGQPADVARARDAGIDVHLTKPVDPEALEAALSNG